MALTTDIIEITEYTLEPGITDVVMTSTGGFENALVATYTVPYGIYPSNMYIDDDALHITYESHTETIYLAVLLIRNNLQVINHLESNLEGAALSAKQGKVLKDALDALDIPSDITDLDDVVISSIQNGQVLAWDSVTEKFVNVDQSAAPSFDLIKKDWIGTTSSAAYTVLTETADLTAGKYIVNVHLPYSTNTGMASFGLSINSALDTNALCTIPISYGNYTNVIELTGSATVKFVTVSSTAMSWDSQYIDRGAMNIIKLE